MSTTASREATDPRKTSVIETIVADLAAETHALDELLGGLADDDWPRATPAAGWSVLDQVTHLAFFDDATLLAIQDAARFVAQRRELSALGDAFPDVVAARHRHLTGAAGLGWLRQSRERLLAAYRDADPATRLPWYGPDMGIASSATGRRMETWAHGQDVRDTLGVPPADTARLRHVADLGVRTLAFCFRLRGRPVPDTTVRVELTGPGGETWTWGPDIADDRVTGRALDFCLVVTQRRNVADTSLSVHGSTATAWIAIAQAFAGAATDPRPARSFPTPPRTGPR